MSKGLKTSFSILSIALLAGLLWVVLNLQKVSEWWVLRNYTPSAEIVSLASDASMNEEGRRLFYIYDPQLLSKSNFTGKCTIGEETIVLGCYISTDHIYVLDVDDERLDGVEEVTAAHEMLHAVYDRLSEGEKTEIDALLLDYYQSLNDERLNETIKNYEKRDPSIVGNELHSILGTEYSNLPAELEAHYSKYFVDRQVVVTRSAEYVDEFERREAQIKVLDGQLESLNAQIDELQTNLQIQSEALEQERQNLESMRGDAKAYNQAVPAYNSSVNQFNRDLEKLKAQINSYNQLVAERNVIALEEQELVKAIDTRLSEVE